MFLLTGSHTERPRMARRSLECYGCGEPVPNLFTAISHCDPNVPVDDIEDDTEWRSIN